MPSYGTYVERIEALAQAALDGQLDRSETSAALDGAPSRELRAAWSLAERRTHGAFFTTSVLRDGPFRNALPAAPRDLKAFDPTCGAGDLLIRWADRLPKKGDLGSTLQSWAPLLHGSDLQSGFVRLARARLVLAAAEVCAPGHGELALDDCLPNLRVEDGLSRLVEGAAIGWVLLNPPFGAVDTPSWMSSSSGKVSQAAVFVSAWAAGARPGDRLVAILPDALRSGTRYRAWRRSFSASATRQSVQPMGQFDVDVDIDVFLLSATASDAPSDNDGWWEERPATSKSKSYLDARVTVGPVVPHRDPETGPLVPFLSATSLPQERVAEAPADRRQFAGRLVTPPFVAIRRTSRPGQTPRARATVVTGTEGIAVENHLIVVRPSESSLEQCLAIAELLEQPESTTWLDNRQCGRHLTTASIRELLGHEV